MRQKIPIQFLLLGGEALAFAGSGAIIFILISRLSGPELLGQYSLSLAWILLFQSIGGFGVSEYLMRELGRFEDQALKYFTHGGIIGLGASLTAMAIMAGMVQFFNYDSDLQTALMFGALVLAPMMVSGICRTGFLAKKRSEMALFIALTEMFIILSVNLFLILNGYGIVPLIMAYLAGKTISAVISLFLFHKFVTPLKWNFNPSFCRQLLPSIFTFAVSNILGLISMRINIIMLSWWTSMSTVGFYAAAGKLMEVVYLLLIIFAQLMLPQVSRTFSEKQSFDLRPFQKEFNALFSIAIPIGIGLLVFAEPAIKLVFGEGFQLSTNIFRILIVFFMVESLDAILGLILKAADRQNQDVRIFISNPLINIALNIILIPVLGGIGAALGKLAGGLLSCSLRYHYIYKNLVAYPWIQRIAPPVIAMGLLVALGYLIKGYASTPALAAGYVLFAGCFVVWRLNLPDWIRGLPFSKK